MGLGKHSDLGSLYQERLEDGVFGPINFLGVAQKRL